MPKPRKLMVPIIKIDAIKRGFPRIVMPNTKMAIAIVMPPWNRFRSVNEIVFPRILLPVFKLY